MVPPRVRLFSILGVAFVVFLVLLQSRGEEKRDVGRPRTSREVDCQRLEVVSCGDRGYPFLGRCFCTSRWSGSRCEQPRSSPPCNDKTDECFVTDYGVAVVTQERWRRAQDAESSLWKRLGATVGDRVDDHMLGFHNYSAVPRNLGKFIEVGCGPWTQSLWMLNLRPYTVESVTLWEPGIPTYISSVPTCTYRSGKLPGYLTVLVAEGAEHLRFNEEYDTLLMINVLEHVQNAFEILENAYRSLKCGGVLIFADRWFNTYDYSIDLASNLDHTFHPIRFHKVVFDHFLKHFRPLYQDYNSPAFLKYGHTGVYFIGQKL